MALSTGSTPRESGFRAPVSELHMSPTVCVNWCISALFGGVCGVHQGGEKCGGNLFALQASWLVQSESGIGFRQRCADV